MQQLGKNGQKLAYATEYFSDYWTDLYRTFSIGSHVSVDDYKTCISFAVAERTLLYSIVTN